MRIKKIVLENIRSYIKQEIVFPESSILLSGDIGSGKSTILLALEFALFGVDTGRLSGNSLLRKGATEAKVELTFLLDSKEVVIKRGLKKGKRSIAQMPGTISIDGKIEQVTPVELKARVIDLLGYPKELITKKQNVIYRYSVYCGQEDMKSILSDDKESRLDTLRKIFGIDKYKRIRENCAVVNRKIKSKIQIMSAKIEDYDDQKRVFEERKTRRSVIDEKLFALVPQSQELKHILEMKTKEFKEIEQQIKILYEKKKQIDVINAQLKIKSETLQKNQEKIVGFQKIIENVKEFVDPVFLEKQIESKDKEISAFSKEKELLKQKLVFLQKNIEQIQKELVQNQDKSIDEKKILFEQIKNELSKKEIFQKQKDVIEKTLSNFQKIIQGYKIKHDQALQLKEKISSLTHCPMCLQNVSHTHKDEIFSKEDKNILFFKQKIDECQKNSDEKKSELEKIQQELLILDEKEKSFVKLKIELELFEKQKELVAQKKESLEKNNLELNNSQKRLQELTLIDIEKEREVVKNLRLQIEKMREYQRSKKDLLDLQNTVLKMNEEIRILQKDCELYKKDVLLLEKVEKEKVEKEKELEVIRLEEKNQAVHVAQLKAEKTAITESITELEKVLLEKKLINEKIVRMKNVRHWLQDYFVELMSIIEKHVMLRIYNEFNELFKSWFGVLISDDGMNARIDDSFNPVIEQNGYDIDISYLSGGERTSAALAYRLALNKVVNDVIHTIKTKDLLILDEPTDGFSTEQLDRVREVLDELKVNQVVIVSHEPKIGSFVESTIQIAKEAGVSRVAI